MADLSEKLRAFSFLTVAFRMLLAGCAGFAVGLGRARKQRRAGLRTYMLVSIGAALTMLISLYEYEMLRAGGWAWLPQNTELKFDGTRYAAQIMSGVGWLAGGTILGGAHNHVSGLTTAIGLFAAAALGLAAGAGFYECVIPGIVMLVFTMEFLQPVEIAFKRRLNNITLVVEFETIDDVSTVTDAVQALGAQVFDIDIERTKRKKNQYPSAVMSVSLSREQRSHSAMLSAVAELPCVRSVQELIS